LLPVLVLGHYGNETMAETIAGPYQALQEQPLAIGLPGVLLGVGLGGFFDGIFLHQVFQWHHMFSSVYPADTVPGLRMNTLGDGLFHTVTWIAVLVGLGILYSRVTEARGRVWGSRVLWGWMLVGWGLFNFVEGLVDHQILGIHHVHPGAHQFAWDVAFLASGIILVAGGSLLQRSGAAIRIDANRATEAHR
jgi:uncharacterized membrane protein